ncbi:MAG: hypothetical protein MI743_21280, partial [Sneathiellales bacterium]|nr:hypothetical protein [Sneathiellales bacterium]
DEEVNIRLENDILIASNLVPLLEKQSVLLPLKEGCFLVRGQDITLRPSASGFQIESSWSRIDGEKLIYWQP